MDTQTLIKILFAEDLPTDVELAIREIKKGGIRFIHHVVDTEPAFIKELNEFRPDIVVSDYSMPTFNGINALKITRNKAEFIPFIMLTGSLNEETAVACMKAGANDYVIKEQIKRLPYAIAEAIDKNIARREKRKVEQQLLESLEEYRQLIDGMNETVWIIDRRGKLLEVNQTAINLLGYSREELLEIGLSVIDRNYDYRIIDKMIRNGPTDNNQFFQTIHTTKSGREIPVEITSSLAKYRGEQVILSIARDISDRIQIEERLLLLSQSVEQSPVSVVITDKNGIIEYVNTNFTKTTGFTSREVIGQTPRIFNSGKHTAELYSNLWSTITEGKEWHGELINKKKNGELYWEDISISCVKNRDNKVTHLVAIREDITEKKKMIDDLVAAKEKAEESDRLKSAFLANMSHEIRTPMNGIMGFTELLKEQRLSGEEQSIYIEIIQKSGERMLNTINDLIEISKIESGSVELNITRVNINEQINYFYRFFKPEAEKKGLKITCKKSLPNSATIETDKDKLIGILSNLIKNAIKYTNEGSIDFGYEIKNSAIDFFVNDTGIGILKERKEQIFDRFIQGDMSLSKPYEGAGLGLSIAKAYVNMLGGEIWVNSMPNQGASFHFSLRYPEQTESTPPDQFLPPIAEKNNDQFMKQLTVLAVEDDTIGRIYLSELLENSCKKILFATNGEEAIAQIKNEPEIDLILMDLRMPGMDGYTATRKIKEFNRQVVIIAQTAYALTGDRDKALSAGCDDYISKPFKKEELVYVIEKHFIDKM